MKQTLKRFKDKLYFYVAEKNWGVRREYGPYVKAHRGEHLKSPWKHWWILVKLNWHYRVLRKETWLLVQQKPGSKSQRYTHPSAKEIINIARKFDVISFDLFGTMVLKPFASEDMLYEIIGFEMHLPDFRRLRRETEAELRRLTICSCGAPSLAAIYARLEERLGIDGARWAKRETELEQSFCVANSCIRDAYRYLFAWNKAIIVNADTCLSSETVSKILRCCSYGKPYILTTSCETKHASAEHIMSVVRKKFGNNVRCLYIGNETDVYQKAGWETVYYKSVNQEKACAGKKCGLAESVYIGLANIFFSQTRGLPNKYKQNNEYGFLFGGILCYTFCKWLNDVARQRGIEKFLFLSNDCDMTNKIYNRFFHEIDTEYILTSHSALSDTVASDLCDLDQTAHKEAVLRYLTECAGESKNLCIVGMQWDNIVFDTLKELLVTHLPEVKVCGAFFVGGKGIPAPKENGVQMYSSLPFDKSELLNSTIPNTAELSFEAIFTSPFPDVTHYEKKDDTYELSFEEFDDERYTRMKECQRGACAFVEYYTGVEKKIGHSLPITHIPSVG